MTIKELRATTGKSQGDFASWLNIPKHTLQNWEQGVRKCPDYVLSLIQFRIEHDTEEEK